MENVFKYARRPELAVVVGSVLLSLIAIAGVVAVGKDAALYLTLAQEVEQQGARAIFSQFDWPWMSIFIAYGHKVSGLSYQAVAFLYSMLFMAGTSLFVVLLVKHFEETAAWWAVLIVLSVPIFNGFRDEIIRESGFWFFITLSVYSLQCTESISWRRGILFQLAVLCAVLFRFEAVFTYFVGTLYCLFVGSSLKEKMKFVLKVNGLCLLAFLGGALFLAAIDFAKIERIQYQLSLIDPLFLYSSFSQTSKAFAEAALLKWSYSDAPKMLFAGMLFALLWRFLVGMGALSFVLIDSSARQELKNQAKLFKANTIAAILYFLILFVFFVQLKFMNSRYMTLLVLLLLPVFIVIASRFFNKHQKWARVFIFFSICAALANVISLGDKKTHYIEAAKWVKNSTAQSASIFYEDARIQYYADRGYGTHRVEGVEQLTPAEKKRFDFFIVEYSKSTQKDYFERLGFSVVEQFSSKKKTMFILQAE